MESKIMVTIPCQFSSSWSSSKCPVCLLAKSIVWVLPPVGLSESPKFTKISCKPGHGLSWKKKHAAELPVSQGTERMRLVLSSSWAFWYRLFSLCKKTPHTYPTHYTHAYTFNSERELSCLVRCCRPRGRWSGSEESQELVALFGKTCRSGTAGCSQPAALTFRQCSKVAEARTAQICSRAYSWSECSSSTSHLIWSPKRHYVAIDLPVAEKTPKCMCYPILGQRKLKANNVDRQLASRKAQSSSCFDLDSDRVTVLVPRRTEVSISIWGKPSELGNSLLSTNQRLFIYTGPQALSWRPSTIRSQVGPGSRLLESRLIDTRRFRILNPLKNSSTRKSKKVAA